MKHGTELSEWLSPLDAAQILGCSPETTKNLARAGKLTFRRERGTGVYRFPLGAVIALRDERIRHPETRGRRTQLRDLALVTV